LGAKPSPKGPQNRAQELQRWLQERPQDPSRKEFPKKSIFGRFGGCLGPPKLSSRLSESSIFTFSPFFDSGPQMAPKMEPKWSQNGPRISSEAVWEGSRSLPKNCPKNRSKNDAKREPLGSPWSTIWEAFWHQNWRLFPDPVWGAILEGLGVDLGRFWGAFWDYF